MDSNVTACYHKYKDTIFKLAFTYCRHTDQAEDILQEVFFKYMIHHPRFQDDDHEKAWFVRTTINACKDILKSKWMRTTVALEERDALSSQKENLENADAERYEDLKDTVLALPDLYRIPIHLYYYEGYSVREIARILRRKESAVQTQLQRGREKIRQFLENRGD